MQDTILHLFGQEFCIPLVAKQVLFAAVVGLAIGFEREWKNKAASLKTFSFISLGSCLFTILSVNSAGGSTADMPFDVTRIAAQVVAGMGFVGGGVIFKTSDRIEGITTAALIWVSASVGMAIGFNQMQTAVWGVLGLLLVYGSSSIIYNILARMRNESE